MSSKRRRQRLHSPHECRPGHRSYQYQSGDQAAPGATSSGEADYAHLPITWHHHYIVAEAQELHPPSSRDDNQMLLEETYIFLLFTLLVRLLLLLLLNDFPQLLRLERHIDMRHAQCISNRIGHRWRRTDSSSFTDAFHTQGVDGCQGHCVIKLKVGKLRGNRHSIIHKRPCQKLTIFTILNSLDQRLANALGNAAMNLTLNNHRIELAATIVNCHKAPDLCLT